MENETAKTPEVQKPYAQTFTEAVSKAIESKDLEVVDNTVTAKIDKLQPGGGIEKVDFQKSYKKLVALTAQGALILAAERTEKGGDNEKTLLQMVTDAFDSGVRSNVRAAIVAEATGPEAGIKKAALALSKALGVPVEIAMEQLRQMAAVKTALGDTEKTDSTQPAEPVTA